MLTGALVPTAGKAMLAGLDVETQQSLVRQLVGYCPQVGKWANSEDDVAALATFLLSCR